MSSEGKDIVGSVEVEGGKTGGGAASIMEGGKRQADGEAAIQDRETRKKAKVSFDMTWLIYCC